MPLNNIAGNNQTTKTTVRTTHRRLHLSKQTALDTPRESGRWNVLLLRGRLLYSAGCYLHCPDHKISDIFLQTISSCRVSTVRGNASEQM